MSHEKTPACLALVSRFPLRPIGSDDELDRAIAILDSMLDQSVLDRGEQGYLDVLAELIRAYENEHHPMSSVSDAEILAHLLDARGESQAVLASVTGIAESTVSEILSGARRMNRRHIEIFCRHFHVPASVFIS